MELYPRRIVNTLGELGTPLEEQSVIEQYLLSTLGGESIDF